MIILKPGKLRVEKGSLLFRPFSVLTSLTSTNLTVSTGGISKKIDIGGVSDARSYPEKIQIPIAAIDYLIVSQNVQLTTQALGLLANYEKKVIIVGRNLSIKSVILPSSYFSAYKLRELQMLLTNSPWRLNFIIKIVRDKIQEMVSLFELTELLFLKVKTEHGNWTDENGEADSEYNGLRLLNWLKNTKKRLHDFLKELGSYKKRIARNLETYVNVLDSQINTLRGYEGRASVFMFDLMKNVLGTFGLDPAFKRRDRKSNDFLNLFFNYAYTLIYNLTTCILLIKNFNPSLGVMHIKRGRHYALASDIMERVRVLLIKHVVFDTVVFNRFLDDKRGDLERFLKGFTDAGKNVGNNEKNERRNCNSNSESCSKNDIAINEACEEDGDLGDSDVLSSILKLYLEWTEEVKHPFRSKYKELNTALYGKDEKLESLLESLRYNIWVSLLEELRRLQVIKDVAAEDGEEDGQKNREEDEFERILRALLNKERFDLDFSLVVRVVSEWFEFRLLRIVERFLKEDISSFEKALRKFGERKVNG